MTTSSTTTTQTIACALCQAPTKLNRLFEFNNSEVCRNCAHLNDHLPNKKISKHCKWCEEGASTVTQTVTKKNAKGIENPLIPADAIIDQTYNGLSGCACGCGGNYTDEGVNTGAARGRINKINVAYLYNPLDVLIENYSNRTMYEITTSVGEEFDRVTRVYVKNAGN
jgi:hypothetical protein